MNEPRVITREDLDPETVRLFAHAATHPMRGALCHTPVSVPCQMAMI